MFNFFDVKVVNVRFEKLDDFFDKDFKIDVGKIKGVSVYEFFNFDIILILCGVFFVDLLWDV